MASPVYLTASGVVGISGVPTTVLSIFVTGSAAGVLNLRNGTSVAAPIKASISVPAGQTVSPTLGPSGLTFSSGLYADFGANIINATFGVT
jgi:molybdopterin-binding protein